MSRRALVIGAGVGGLAVSGLLAREGWDVTVVEKNRESGGRLGRLSRKGFRFDTGATLFLMREVFEDLYARLGTRLVDHLDLHRIDPHCRLQWADGTSLHLTADLLRLREGCEALEPGSGGAVLSFLARGWFLYRESMRHLIGRDFSTAGPFLDPRLWLQFIRPDTWRNRWRQVSAKFRTEKLRTAFACQDLYIGMSPYRAPAIYSIMPAMELLGGLWVPRGGMYRIAESLESIARSHGARFLMGTGVREILREGKRACGVALENGRRLEADLVVANADLPYVHQELLAGLKPPRRLARMKTSCSSHTFYWGFRRPLRSITDQHGVFFGADWKAGVECLTPGKPFPNEPHFYLNAPTRHDPAAAPRGQDALMVVVPCPPLPAEVGRREIRRYVLERLSALEGRRIEKDLVFEAGFTPKAWRDKYHLKDGAMLGSLDHRLSQMGPLRPSNRHGRLGNLYFVGGSTRPASGVPMVVLSAMLTAQRIAREQAA
ncbi:MAG: phytoene desaturase [Spirochaetes bacterium]|nr:phytoene desaturase [Spirochaetota bacterium]